MAMDSSISSAQIRADYSFAMNMAIHRQESSVDVNEADHARPFFPRDLSLLFDRRVVALSLFLCP